ncbi:glycosyltransferase [bacterium]|nr:glycosyltransferase [bacterium]
MDSENLLSILFVLDSSPQSGASLAFFNSFVEQLADCMSEKAALTLFYPEFSDKEEHFSLSITQSPKYRRMVTYIPTRLDSFSETYLNEKMDDIFSFILKDAHFDAIHIWSLKNHSFNYPAIAKERGIPVVYTFCDGFLFSNSLFEKGLGESMEKVRVSNFVNSSITSFVRRLISAVKPKSRSYWFENIGRFSRYYNRVSESGIDPAVFGERAEMADEVISFCDKFVFFSELEYNLFYRPLIAENKAVFMEQGIMRELDFWNRPFEIEGAVKFCFMGEILPEEGILELVEAFNILYEEGYRNELHIYGETHENSPYFNRLKQRVKSPDIFFHGLIQGGRMNAVLNTADVLIIPAKWPRNDTFLVNNAVSERKALIVSSKNAIAEKVRRSGRGIVLDEITPRAIAEAVSELERNRKRLYYFMRVTDDFRVPDISENCGFLLSLYSEIAGNYKEADPLLLAKRLNRRRKERQRG